MFQKVPLAAYALISAAFSFPSTMIRIEIEIR